MNKNDGRKAKAFTDELKKQFDTIADEDEKAELAAKVKTLDEAFDQETAVGAQLEIRQMQYAAARLTAVLESDQERARRCLCLGVFPTCPPDLGKPPFHVPIACITGLVDDEILITKVCMFECRKQAMTWRSANYVIKDWREKLAINMAKFCCVDEDTDTGAKKPGLTYDPNFGKDGVADLATRYRVFDDVIGDQIKLSGTFIARPDLGDLSLAAARDVVSGLGGEVAETIDIADDKAIDLIDEKTGGDGLALLGASPDFEPGDKVAILTQNGQARGYVVLERGGGKYVFTPESEKKKLTGKPSIGGLTEDRLVKIGELAEKLKTVTDSETRIDTEITELGKTRDALEADVARLKEETAALDASRETAKREIAAANEEFRKLADAQRESVEVMAKAREELAEAETQKETFVKVMRENQPVASLTLDQNIKKKLSDNNIISVEEAAKRADAIGLTINQRRALLRRIDNFVNTGQR